MGTGSCNVRKYIACLSKLCHRKRLKWHMPPRRVFTTAGAREERKLFWHAWDMLLQERKRLYSTRISLKALAAHMERVRNILPLAPQKWVREIFGLSDAWTLPYDKSSTLVYCIATLKNGRKYIGQTGGRGTLRSMAKRFKEHIPACALQGIAARWLSAHYKTIARSIARAMARGLGFVTPCPNKQGKNAYFSKVSDASGTASDAVNVREDCKHFGPPLWVVPVEERGPFGGLS